MKKLFKLIVLLGCMVITFIGIVIWAVLFTQGGLKPNTVIKLNGATHKTLQAELSGFYPGNEQEYKIVTTGEGTEGYEITLAFRGNAKSGGLENYLLVTITTKDVAIEKPLAELLGGTPIELGKNASEITITYVMPENTGNEAQGTTADFYIDFTATIDQ